MTNEEKDRIITNHEGSTGAMENDVLKQEPRALGVHDPGFDRFRGPLLTGTLSERPPF